MKWTLLDTGKASSKENMMLDSELLEKFAVNLNQLPILHLYGWNRPSATYGYFIDPWNFLNESVANEIGLDLARRPTGGGIVFHLTDFAFSFLVPSNHPGYSVNILENYAFINAIVIKAIKAFKGQGFEPTLLPIEPVALDTASANFCMAKPTKYDVILDGKKVGGGAQRRTKHGFLHQGTLSLTVPDYELMKRLLLPGTCILEAMSHHTYALLDPAPTPKKIEEARQQLANIFVNLVSQ